MHALTSQSHSPDFLLKGGATFAYVKNHLGSITLVAEALSGGIAQRIEYDPWGNITNDSAPGFQPFAFAGGIYDGDTKLFHFGFRDYDSATGTWTAKDPLRVGGGSNLFAYAANHPTGLIDASGLWVEAVFDPNTRLLTLTDPTTGESISAFTWSGTNPDEMVDHEGVIPAGDYAMLMHGATEMYINLDSMDSTPGDDRDDRSGRSNFRLHVPGASQGCMAIGLKGLRGVRPEGDASAWDAVKQFIYSRWELTSWRMHNGKPKPHFGHLKVLPMNRIK